MERGKNDESQTKTNAIKKKFQYKLNIYAFEKVLLRLAYIAFRILKDSEAKLCACMCGLNNFNEAQW